MISSNRLLRWKMQWYPDRYHGWGRTKSYFEGWYFKMVMSDGSLAISVIPGVSMDENGDRHAFIQVIDGTKTESFYYEFPFEDFHAEPTRFAVRIGTNYFSKDEITLNLPDLKGTIQMSDHTPWPKTLGAPGIMGWYSFVPKMQCYHGVLSLYHQLSGSLELKNTAFNFEQGIGYIEKDWGTSFPKCWIWLHSNHFELPDRKVSLLASIAHIPWMGNYFVGFLVGFYLDDELYQFTTHNGANISTMMDEDKVYMTCSRKDTTLSIIATKAPGADLVSPISGGMRGKVNESISAKIQVVLSRAGKVMYEGVGQHSGMEIGGEIDVLLNS